jgi:hypothetical protein
MLMGGCLCGQVRYTANTVGLEPAFCHCALCRRSVSGPVAAWVGAAPDAVRLTGELVAYASSDHGRRTFCGGCGTQVMFEDDLTPDYVDLSAGSLDAPEQAPPIAHVWAANQLPWLKLDDGLPAYRAGSDGARL